MEDARLEEIAYLKMAASQLTYSEPAHPTDTFARRMIVELIADGHLNGPGSISYSRPAGVHYTTVMTEQLQAHTLLAMANILESQSTMLSVSHKGRVRLARLLSEMQTQRGRDPSGLVWSKRHFDDDLRIAVMDASTTKPVAIAVMDMNGLKAINDAHGHEKGDEAIKALLGVVADRCTKEIEAYRGDGGDEVYLIFRQTTLDDAAVWVRKMLESLGTQPGCCEKHGQLRASCGLAVCSNSQKNTDTSVKEADDLMYQAKKEKGSRKSALVIAGGAVDLVG